MIYERIFTQLDNFGVIVLIRENAEAAKSESCGYMDLHFDRLYESEGGVVISLAHYFMRNGDLCCDPDMEIRVLPARKLAEALTFQQAISTDLSDGLPGSRVGESLAPEVAQCLFAHLAANCVAQGHRFGHRESGA